MVEKAEELCLHGRIVPRGINHLDWCELCRKDLAKEKLVAEGGTWDEKQSAYYGWGEQSGKTQEEL